MLKNSWALLALVILSASAQAQVFTYRAELSGANEYDAVTDTLGVGDPDGWGTALIHINSETDLVSWTVNFHNLSTLLAAHIHTGAAGQNGPVLIPLNVPAGLSGHGAFTGQLGWFPNAYDVISSAPFDFYVNVHTNDFAAGAIRGQLQAVPEPGTWALMGMGLGVGALLRRRRRQN